MHDFLMNIPFLRANLRSVARTRNNTVKSPVLRRIRGLSRAKINHICRRYRILRDATFHRGRIFRWRVKFV